MDFTTKSPTQIWAERCEQRKREELVPLETVAEPEIMQEMPAQLGPLFSVYKRTPTGYNKIALYGLLEDEARKACEWLNTLAQAKRKQKLEDRHEHGLECVFDANEIVLYDVVAMDTEQENPYWNPPRIIQ